MLEFKFFVRLSFIEMGIFFSMFFAKSFELKIGKRVKKRNHLTVINNHKIMKSLKLITTIIALFVSVFAYANKVVSKPEANAVATQSNEKQTPMKIIYGPYVHVITETEATVVWVTNKPAISWVEIAPDDGTHFYAKQRPRYFNAPLGRKCIDTFHTIKIKDLKEELRKSGITVRL